MRILQLIETGGPGGAETVFATLSSGLVERGHAVTALVGEGNWLPAEMARRKIPTTLLTRGGAFDRPLLAQIRRTIRDEQIDVVHAHLFEGAVYASLAARLEGVPSLTTLHGQVDVQRGGARARVKQWLFSRSTRCVACVSDALRRDLQDALRLPPSRLRVIPNGVVRGSPRPADAPTMRTSARTGSTRQLIAIGNIRQPKDYPTLLAAVAVLRAQAVDVHLHIAGQPDGDGLFESLQRQAQALEVASHVTFHGFVADPMPLLAQADCFVLSSSKEGFSLATIEAMLAGVCVVATRSGGPEEILRDGETGLLVPVGDPASLAAAIRRVIEDRTLATQLAAAALADATQRFSIDRMVSDYERVYREVTGR